MNQTIIKEITSYNFEGFYESPYLNSDEFIDYESEDLKELKELKLKGIKDPETLEVIYEYEDINLYQCDVSKAYIKNHLETIKEILPYEILNNKDFLLEIKDPEYIEVDSPEYYNYRTDRLYTYIETNYKTLCLIKWYVLKKSGAKEYIKNRFTSCDGFISFIDNHIIDWKLKPINEYELNQLSVLLDMVINLNKDQELKFNIMLETLESVNKLEYAFPVVYYDGTNCDYWEFIERIKNYDKQTKYINKNLEIGV